MVDARVKRFMLTVRMELKNAAVTGQGNTERGKLLLLKVTLKEPPVTTGDHRKRHFLLV